MVVSSNSHAEMVVVVVASRKIDGEMLVVTEVAETRMLIV